MTYLKSEAGPSSWPRRRGCAADFVATHEPAADMRCRVDRHLRRRDEPTGTAASLAPAVAKLHRRHLYACCDGNAVLAGKAARCSNPVGAGFVDTMARPGGNATGFVSLEYGMSSKWLELIKEVAPRVSRVAVIRDPRDGCTTGVLRMHAIRLDVVLEMTEVGFVTVHRESVVGDATVRITDAGRQTLAQ